MFATRQNTRMRDRICAISLFYPQREGDVHNDNDGDYDVVKFNMISIL